MHGARGRGRLPASQLRVSLRGRPAPEYHLLAAFVAVADEHSFTKAARKLGIGKGTVSRSIATLEEQLGAELIHRTTHAVALSTAGVALYERVASVTTSCSSGTSPGTEPAWGCCHASWRRLSSERGS